MTIHLHGLGTALPPHELPQDVVRDHARAMLGPKYPQFQRLVPAFESAGIDRRHSVVPLEWFSADHGWSERNAAYLDGARRLFADAARAALAAAEWEAGEVDCIVTVSSTGIATPTLEALAMEELGFRRDVQRVPVFGLGCAGGVSGLSIAQTLASARRDARILLVVVETCTLSFRTDRLQKADIIATVLFGDGGAAACLSGRAPRGRRIAVGSGTQVTWPRTLGIMGWDVDDTGFGVVFDRAIPDFVDGHLADAAADALSALGLDRADLDGFVCHPGGAKVIAAIEAALRLDPGALAAERAVLRDAGNMSAPTVLFVLHRALSDGASGRQMTLALGPGFTGAFLPLEIEAAA